MNANEQAVAAVLAKYQDALNQSDTNAVMKLYASDGVFMPQHFPSSVGADAVRKAYDSVFKAIKLSVKFNVAEIHRLLPNGHSRAPIRPERLRSKPVARAARRPTRNSSCSRRSTAPGRSRATASPPRIHRKQRDRRAYVKAAWYEKQGPARDVLVVGEMPDPVPAAGEVRIRIAASGINPGRHQEAGEHVCYRHGVSSHDSA